MTIMTMDHTYNPDGSIKELNPNCFAYVVEFIGGRKVAYSALPNARCAMCFGKVSEVYALLQGKKYDCCI